MSELKSNCPGPKADQGWLFDGSAALCGSDEAFGQVGRMRPTAAWFVVALDTVISGLTAMLLILIVSVTTIQVAMRYLFNAPLPWPEELTLWAFLWLVMLGIASATRDAGHIRVDALIGALPSTFRCLAELFVVALTALSLALLGYLGISLARGTTMTSINLAVPYAYLYLAIPAGAALALLNLARARVAGVARAPTLLAVVIGIAVAGPVHQNLGSMLDGANPTLLGVTALIGFIMIGVPIAHSLLLGAYGAFQAGMLPSVVIANHFASTMATNYVLLAIPFFILMGALMNVGGVTRTLIDAANVLVGHWRGGLAQVNVLTSALMGGLSGSSSADTATTTKTLVPQMERSGYDRGFACAITASSSITANLLPPSITLLIYASLASQSVGALFMAGIIPGVLLTLTLMLLVWALARSGTFRVEAAPRAEWRTRARTLIGAAPALALPIVIVMMLRGGAVTPTEAGAMACIYALALGAVVYRGLRPAATWRAVCEAGRETAVILFLVAASAPMAWMVVVEGVPQLLVATLGEMVTNPSLMILGLIGVMLLVGFFLEPPPAMVILVPILLPLAQAVGIDPVHLGVVVVATVMVGQLTPPVGGLVFITAAIAKIGVLQVFWALRWIYVVLAMLLAVLALVPAVSLMLPRLFGFL